jgi:hypothetical protein
MGVKAMMNMVRVIKMMETVTVRRKTFSLERRNDRRSS